MKRIGEILVDQGVITPAQLETALDRQKKDMHDKKVGEILIELGYINYDALLLYLESQLRG